MKAPFRLLAVVAVLAASAFAAGSAAAYTVGNPVNVTHDQLSQNETPLAVDPANPSLLLSGSNDWNYNDGCGMYTSTNGGKSWSGALPEGYLPGITKYTNDPNVPGTGAYDAGGDPVVAFSPDGESAYFVCQSFNFTPPYEIQLLLNRGTVTSTGITWQTTGLTPISTWNGNGKTKGGNGQFPDHESIHVDASGRIYVTWAQFTGKSAHSPVLVATSTDGGRSFSTPVAVTVSNIRNNQDQRIVTAPNGDAYLTFDNGVQGGKGTVLYVSKSTDGGATWSSPILFATLANPVCIFPDYCFNISGGQFRAGGTYPVPAFDPVRNRLVVVYADIVGPYGQMYMTSAPASDLTNWTAPTAFAPAPADQFMGEFGIAPNGRYDASFYDRRYTNNMLVDLTYATSNDGGATWSTARVSKSSSFDPSTWGVPSSSALGYRPFIGDYNGLVSRDAWAGLTWTGVAAPQPYNLEIYFAKVTQ